MLDLAYRSLHRLQGFIPPLCQFLLPLFSSLFFVNSNGDGDAIRTRSGRDQDVIEDVIEDVEVDVDVE